MARAGAARPPIFPPPDREIMVPVKGGRIYVRTNGASKSGKLPIVLVHGGPGATHTVLLDALQLANERMVILYDQLDSGRSDQPNEPGNWRVDRFVDELEAIRSALGVGKWHVFGHSWGGTLALEYGARRPAALAGLVLASPLISTRRWIADTNALRAKLPPDIQADLTQCQSAAPPPKSKCDAANLVFEGAFYRREPDSPARMAYAHPQDRGFNSKLYGTMWGSSEFVSTGSLRNYDGETLLARLDGRRTLFLIGQYDEVRMETAATFAEQAVGAELAVVPGAAHAFLSDRPDESIGLLRAWLSRQEASP